MGADRAACAAAAVLERPVHMQQRKCVPVPPPRKRQQASTRLRLRVANCETAAAAAIACMIAGHGCCVLKRARATPGEPDEIRMSACDAAAWGFVRYPSPKRSRRLSQSWPLGSEQQLGRGWMLLPQWTIMMMVMMLRMMRGSRRRGGRATRQQGRKVGWTQQQCRARARKEKPRATLAL